VGVLFLEIANKSLAQLPQFHIWKAVAPSAESGVYTTLPLHRHSRLHPPSATTSVNVKKDFENPFLPQTAEVGLTEN